MKTSYLVYARKRIEERLGWGPAASWSTQDFEILSERLLESTGQVVSATTLKRIWGRVRYDSSPSPHTLDTLALFLGYQNWRHFKQQHPNLSPPPLPARPPKPVDPKRPALTRLSVPLLVGVGALVVLGLVWMGLSAEHTDASVNAAVAEVTFSSRPVSSGLPNTVVFNYDVSGIPADSFFIQQSWDERLRTRVSPEGHAFTTLYYYPGFFQAKLIANQRILKEHPLHITTDGWLALIEEDPIPRYLPPDVLNQPGAFALDPAWLTDHDINVQNGEQWISYYQVRDFGPVDSDAFTLETELKNPIDRGHAVCRHSQLIIMAEHGRMMIPLSIPGCVGDLNLLFSDTFVDGQVNDLSGLGADLQSWQRLRIEVEQKKASLYLNDEPVYELAYAQPAGRIVGLRYRFQGPGALNFVRLYDAKHTLVYADEF